MSEKNPVETFTDYLKTKAVKFSDNVGDGILGIRFVEISGDLLRQVVAAHKTEQLCAAIMAQLPDDAVLSDLGANFMLQAISDRDYKDAHLLLFGSKSWYSDPNGGPIGQVPVHLDIDDLS